MEADGLTSTANRKILIVDDDPGIQELLELALEAEGYDVRVARDGLEGLEMVAEEMPHLVILDLMMPRLDGFGFERELSVRGLRNSVPIMVLTAASRGQERRADITAEAYIDKPFSLPEFLDEVARLSR